MFMDMMFLDDASPWITGSAYFFVVCSVSSSVISDFTFSFRLSYQTRFVLIFI